MPTLIDSFAVRIGIDRASLDAETREADAKVAAFKKDLKAHAKETEDQLAKTFAGSWHKVLLELTALFGALLAARGIKDFTEDTVRAEVQTSLLASTIGESVERVSGWQQAVQRAGGSTASASAALVSLNDRFMQMRLMGARMPRFWWEIGGANIDTSKGVVETLVQISRQIHAAGGLLSTGTEATAYAKLGTGEGGVGLPPDIARMVIQNGPERLQKLLTDTSPTAMTGAQAAAGQNVWSSVIRLSQTVQSVGHGIVASVSPKLTEIVTQLTSWIDDNKQIISAWVGKRLDDLMNVLKAIDWEAMFKTFQGFIDGFKKGGDSAQKIEFAVIAIALLWQAGNIARMTGAVADVTTMFILASKSMWPVIAALTALWLLYKAVAPDSAKASEAALGDVLKKALAGMGGAGGGTVPKDMSDRLLKAASGGPQALVDDLSSIAATPFAGDAGGGFAAFLRDGINASSDGMPIGANNPVPIELDSGSMETVKGLFARYASTAFGGNLGQPGSSRLLGGGTQGKWYAEHMDQVSAGYDKLIKAGYSPLAAAGIMAVPATIESRGGPGVMNSTGHGGGWQWSQARGGSRMIGLPLVDTTGAGRDQVGHLIEEMAPGGPEQKAGDILRGAQTGADVGRGMEQFERGGYQIDPTLAERYLKEIQEYQRSRRPPFKDAAPQSGAKPQAQLYNDNLKLGSSTSNTYSMPSITVHTAAADPAAIARDVREHLHRELGNARTALA